MSHKKLYVAGELSYHRQPSGIGIPVKFHGKGKSANEGFFLLMFSRIDCGYLTKEEITERLENHSKTQEVIKNGYKR